MSCILPRQLRFSFPARSPSGALLSYRRGRFPHLILIRRAQGTVQSHLTGVPSLLDIRTLSPEHSPDHGLSGRVSRPQSLPLAARAACAPARRWRRPSPDRRACPSALHHVPTSPILREVCAKKRARAVKSLGPASRRQGHQATLGLSNLSRGRYPLPVCLRQALDDLGLPGQEKGLGEA